MFQTTRPTQTLVASGCAKFAFHLHFRGTCPALNFADSNLQSHTFFLPLSAVFSAAEHNITTDPGKPTNVMASSRSDLVVPRTSAVTFIKPTDEYLAQLRGLAHPVEALKSKGFVVEELTKEELEFKKPCRTCGSRGKFQTTWLSWF